MRNLYRFSEDNSFIAESKLVNRKSPPPPGGKTRPTLAATLKGNEKLSPRAVKRGDRAYNRAMKKASKLSAGHFKKRLVKKVIPKIAKKYVDKKLAEYGMKDAKGKKANKLADLMAKEIYRFTDIPSLQGQAASNIGMAAYKAAGYKPQMSDQPTINLKGTKSMYEEYKNPCSKMNGNVPKAKLATVISKVKTIAIVGLDKAVTDKMEPQLRSAMSKHASAALSG